MTPGPASTGDAMVVTSHPLAVEAGLDVLRDGGTAADAAIAAAAMLCVVDPRSTGLAGDLFALHWAAGASAPEALCAAGSAPSGMTIDALHAAGYSRMPLDGPWSVTVPGAPAGLQALHDRAGRLERSRLLAPAIAAARSGFAIAPTVAREWIAQTGKLEKNDVARRWFLPEGRTPREGETLHLPELAETLDVFAAEGPRPFYGGGIASAMADEIAALGGPLTARDLADWRGPEWATPISTTFRDVEVLVPPPPGQGLVALIALGMLSGLDGSDDVVTADALARAIADAERFLADPGFADVPVAELLDEARLSRERATLGRSPARRPATGGSGDTVFVAVRDGDGAACALIQSLYEGFGSGVGVPGTGLVLHNRASGFTFDRDHPNAPAPGKRPFHTIFPTMLARDGRLAGVLGVVGGFMQPQGQVQILQRLLSGGTAQDAVDAPRFRLYPGNRLGLEPGFPIDRATRLAAAGWRIERLARSEQGGAQLIWNSNGEWQGGTDPRKDGVVGVLRRAEGDNR